MKKINLILFVISMLVTSSVGDDATQRGSFYAGGAFNVQNIYRDDSAFLSQKSGQDRTAGLTGVVGYQNAFGFLLPNRDFSLDVEARISKSLLDEDFADILNYGVYIKPNYTVMDKLDIYALIGVGQIYVENDSSGDTMLDDTIFLWGLGLSTPLVENLILFADYTSTATNIESELDSTQEFSGYALNMGLNYIF